MISNLMKTKLRNMKWWYYVLIAFGSAYIIELILGLSLLSGIFSLFDYVNSTIDRRNQAIGEPAAFKFADEFFYESSYKDLVKGYEKASEGALKSITKSLGEPIRDYHNCDTDFRDDLQERGSRLGNQAYAKDKKRLAETFNANRKTIDLEAELDSIREFSALKAREQTSSLEEHEINEYNKQLAEYINSFRKHFRSVQAIIKAISVKNDTKRNYIEQLKLRLATSDQTDRNAIIAYINSIMFDQLVNDEDFIIYAALQNPNYEYHMVETNFKDKSYDEAHYGGRLFAELWPVIRDIVNNREYLAKHNIELFSNDEEKYMDDVHKHKESYLGIEDRPKPVSYSTVLYSDEELRSVYKYMVVHNKAKLKAIPAKYPPRIMVKQSEEQDVKNSEAVETIEAGEVTNE